MTDVTTDLRPMPLPEIPPPPAEQNEQQAVVDFFGGVEDTAKFYFPGQDTQYIEFQIMNEGMRKRYQRKTSRDIKVDRRSNQAQIGIDPAGDRESLLEETVLDWYIIDVKGTGRPVPFSKPTFRNWLNKANPVLIDKLELAIRTANPWMQDEMEPEAIQEEIDRLEKLKKDIEARQEDKS